jgi:hypothetical protein
MDPDPQRFSSFQSFFFLEVSRGDISLLQAGKQPLFVNPTVSLTTTGATKCRKTYAAVSLTSSVSTSAIYRQVTGERESRACPKHSEVTYNPVLWDVRTSGLRAKLRSAAFLT